MSDHDSLNPRSGFGAWLPLIAGPGAGAIAYMLVAQSAPAASPTASRAAFVLGWMALWWLTEAAPLAITSLLPLVLFPLLGVSGGKEAAAPYADRIIYLYVGGFLLALAMEKWGLHRRVALRTLLLVGSDPVRIVGGVMLVTGVISMWVSNTATTMMMLPIVSSLIDRHERSSGKPAGNFGLCLLLGIAYAASIGGIGTPIGTPPNAILIAFVEKQYARHIGFMEWTMIGMPVAVIFLLIAWLYLTRFAFPIRPEAATGGREDIRRDHAALGPLLTGERAVFIVFLLTASAWMLREPIAALLPESMGKAFISAIDDTSIALIGGLILFVIPVDRRARTFVMGWSDVRKLPWDVLLLFGGGLSLAAGVQSSGLAEVLAAALGATAAWPPALTMLLLLIVAVFLSEITSNTAQANLFMPILASVAAAAVIPPLHLLVPCTLALSCAFMMPMGTPPNAIIFGTGHVTIRQMAWAGFGLNWLGIAVVFAAAMTLVPWLFGAG